MPLDELEMKLLAARIALGQCDRQEIYSIADDLATEGVHDPNIIQVLIEGEKAYLEDILPHFVAYLSSQDVPIPEKEFAQILICYVYAKKMEAGQKSIGEAAWLMYRDALMRAGYASAYNLDFVHDFELYMNGDLVQEARHNFSVAAHNLVEDFEAGNLAGWRKARNYS